MWNPFQRGHRTEPVFLPAPTDLQAAWEKAMEKKTVRDADRHRRNPKLG